MQRETCTFTGKKRVPHKLPLQLLSILAVHQLVYALMDDVGLKQTKKGSQQSEEGGKFRVEKKKFTRSRKCVKSFMVRQVYAELETYRDGKMQIKV